MPILTLEIERCCDCGDITTWEPCANCHQPHCHECLVSCAGTCGDTQEICVRCAAKWGWEKRGGGYYCENCQGDEA